MVTEFSMNKMLPLNLWSKQSMQSSSGGESGSGAGSTSLLSQMPFGHPLAATPGFLPVSFSSALFRPGEHLPHGLYNYPSLHPSFFRPHLDPAALGNLLNHRGMIASLHHGAESRSEPHPSAFTPAKRLRMHEDSHSPRDMHSPHSPRDDLGSRDHDRDTSGSSNRTSPMTPLNRSSYSPASSLGHHRPNGDMMEPHLVNGAEDLRLKWKCDDGEGLRCPICKALLQPGEIRTHLYKEFTSLKEELQSTSAKNNERLAGSRCDLNDGSSRSRYDTFLRIRRNRETRLGKLRGDRNKRKRYSDEMSHTSVSDHDDSMRMDHMTPRAVSPYREATEEETVDVTSCEDPDVSVIFSYPSATSTSTSTPATSTSTVTTTDRHTPESKETIDRNCISRQSPYADPRMT